MPPSRMPWKQSIPAVKRRHPAVDTPHFVGIGGLASLGGDGCHWLDTAPGLLEPHPHVHHSRESSGQSAGTGASTEIASWRVG